jgi:hypothetical protein
VTLLKSRGKAVAGLASAVAAVAALAGCSTASSASAGPGSSATSTAAPTATVTPAASASSPSVTSPSASSPSVTSPSASSPSVTSPSASSPPASSPPASSAPNGAAGASACPSSDLRVSLGSASGTAGSVYQYIEFKNVSAASCTLYGFPGVSLLGGRPARQIGAAATRAPNSRPSLVTLAPGGMASALMRVTDALNYPAATCHPVASTTLRVYPPNQTVPQTVPYASTGCGASSVKLLQINAVQPGTGNPPGATS